MLRRHVKPLDLACLRINLADACLNCVQKITEIQTIVRIRSDVIGVAGDGFEAPEIPRWRGRAFANACAIPDLVPGIVKNVEHFKFAGCDFETLHTMKTPRRHDIHPDLPIHLHVLGRDHRYLQGVVCQLATRRSKFLDLAGAYV